MNMTTVLPPYEARRRRSTWPDSVRLDSEVKALDEEQGEWILCRTCADHYEKTQRGRKPNDPEGFKVKMNGRFQEAAWIMHKSRVVAHRLLLTSNGADPARFLNDADDLDSRKRPHEAITSEETQDISNGTDNEELESDPNNRVGEQPRPVHFFVEDMKMDEDDADEPASFAPNAPSAMLPATHVDENALLLMNIPRTGWKCPGIVPDGYYNENAESVHAFAKYYVGSYRINIVRDIRTDRVMLFSHDCENQVIQRDRPTQSIACHKCCEVWSHRKSFRRVLKKMARYVLVEDILRRSWAVSDTELMLLSRFKHASGANLNIEGRKLKDAVIAVLRHYSSSHTRRVIDAGDEQLPESDHGQEDQTILDDSDSLHDAENQASFEGLEGTMRELHRIDPHAPKIVDARSSSTECDRARFRFGSDQLIRQLLARRNGGVGSSHAET
ncbi:hypothetical protein Poli38472_000353 [Pythium oligandrum]|uniref:Uncharacterized protein n=1 Tax=Pythium oligandrum TaxID=41045 RepID=A0A8K1CCB0_PYTOL|nr:hypothetical protein Poli38472_000353 [Pythium oligandrum]|eukprot:TMW60311.1 hypothetical protein Poli38472_000353 [Pythium oligandrum]